jgi:hypothetical protein
MALDLPRQREGKVLAAIGPLGQLVDCHVILEEQHALIDSEASGCVQEELLAPQLMISLRQPTILRCPTGSAWTRLPFEKYPLVVNSSAVGAQM